MLRATVEGETYLANEQARGEAISVEGDSRRGNIPS